MGARCNFVFKQSAEHSAVVLYSHWGEDSRHSDLAQALQHAAVRKGDHSYYTRMAISCLLKDNVMDETGYGIYSANQHDIAYMDTPIIIDLVNSTIEDETGIHDINDFINYHVGALTV